VAWPKRDIFAAINRERCFFGSRPQCCSFFIASVYIFDVRHLSQHASQILTILVALFSALVGSTLPGQMKLTLNLGKKKATRIEASSGMAIMVFVMLWWKSDLTPIQDPAPIIKFKSIFSMAASSNSKSNSTTTTNLIIGGPDDHASGAAPANTQSGAIPPAGPIHQPPVQTPTQDNVGIANNGPPPIPSNMLDSMHKSAPENPGYPALTMSPIAHTSRDLVNNSDFIVISHGVDTYSATITNLSPHPVSWQWFHSLNDGPSTAYSSGTGDTASVTYFYPGAKVEHIHHWKLEANNEYSTASSQIQVNVADTNPLSAPIDLEAHGL
jgi:hypothetical protein